jgi:hypothetical protein
MVNLRTAESRITVLRMIVDILKHLHESPINRIAMIRGVLYGAANDDPYLRALVQELPPIEAETRALAVGDVVQIDPDRDPRFGGCLLVVTELKPAWNGLQGYCDVPNAPTPARAYFRCRVEDVAYIGSLVWRPVDELEDEAHDP